MEKEKTRESEQQRPGLFMEATTPNAKASREVSQQTKEALCRSTACHSKQPGNKHKLHCKASAEEKLPGEEATEQGSPWGFSEWRK